MKIYYVSFFNENTYSCRIAETAFLSKAEAEEKLLKAGYVSGGNDIWASGSMIARIRELNVKEEK